MAQKLVWEQTFRSSQGGDLGNAVAVDSAGVYVAKGAMGGKTTAKRPGFKAALPGQTNVGVADGYVEKYDFSGILVWTRQFGTTPGAAYGFATGGDGVYGIGKGAAVVLYSGGKTSVSPQDNETGVLPIVTMDGQSATFQFFGYTIRRILIL